MIRLAGRCIGEGMRPFVVAEMSGNHNRDLDRALAIVEAAARAGADAVKLQTYTADTMTVDSDLPDFRVTDSGSPWAGRTLYDLYAEAATPWEWHRAIFDLCADCGLLCFSTPFDTASLEFLESLHVPAYKIASQEIVDLPLIAACASTGRPLILSTGMATMEELDEAVDAARGAGCTELLMLRCTSTYPASPDDIDLRTLPHMRDRYGCEVGLSDHTMGVGAAAAAVALGAALIEKHLCLSRADGGVDSGFSSEPDEFSQLVSEVERAWRSLGDVRYGPTEAERESLRYRRSLYVAADVRAGEILTKENVRAIRPGFGLAPKHLPAVLGKPVVRDVAAGTPLSWDLVSR